MLIFNSRTKSKKVQQLAFTALLLSATLLGIAAPVSAQSTFKLLHGFLGANDGAYPASGVTLGPNGSIYGTTFQGGPANDGTIFYISPSGWFKVLYAFSGGADGQYPVSQLLEMGGEFYGTTILGGAYNAGTVFKVTPAGVETIVHSFSVTDGQGPYGALIHDTDGNLYGAASFGSAYGYGNVYRIDHSGVETTLYSFQGGTDGQYPQGRLARDARGNLFGTTVYGGANSCGSYNCGTVFKINASGVETVLYSFGGFPLGDGELPQSDVIEDLAGNLYGTTASQTPGIVFKVNQAGQETILYNFIDRSDGGYPGIALVRDVDGDIYGTVGGGGTDNYGGVFKLNESGAETLLYNFSGLTDGGEPNGGVVQDAAGNLYGTTPEKGVAKFGTVFELTFP
jgi:uncharacterized repeat protein (TIGR03803 family)